METGKPKGLRKNLILLAALELVSGMFMIVFNDKSFDMIIKILGIVAAAYGIITFLAWVIKKDKSGGAPVIITAILGVVAGAFLVFLTDSVLGIFTLFAGIFAGIFGVIKLPNMFTLKKSGFKSWWIILIPIALIVGIGIFIGLKLNETQESLSSILLGVALIIGCAADIITTAGSANSEKQLIAAETDKSEE